MINITIRYLRSYLISTYSFYHILDGVQADTLVVLVNVLYFKDDWKDEPFGETTDTDIFYLGGGQTLETDFMEADEVRVGYKDLRDVEIVSIPFEHDNYHFVIVAPKEGSGKSLEIEDTICQMFLIIVIFQFLIYHIIL